MYAFPVSIYAQCLHTCKHTYMHIYSYENAHVQSIHAYIHKFINNACKLQCIHCAHIRRHNCIQIRLKMRCFRFDEHRNSASSWVPATDPEDHPWTKSGVAGPTETSSICCPTFAWPHFSPTHELLSPNICFMVSPCVSRKSLGRGLRFQTHTRWIVPLQACWPSRNSIWRRAYHND